MMFYALTARCSGGIKIYYFLDWFLLNNLNCPCANDLKFTHMSWNHKRPSSISNMHFFILELCPLKIPVFPLTCSKLLGSVGKKNILFLKFIFS